LENDVDVRVFSRIGIAFSVESPERKWIARVQAGVLIVNQCRLQVNRRAKMGSSPSEATILLQSKLQVNRRLLQLKCRPFGPLIWSTIKMQKHRSWQEPFETEWQEVWRHEAVIGSLMLGRSVTPVPMWLPRIWASAATWSFQVVYDLAAKRRFSLRFNCKTLARK